MVLFKNKYFSIICLILIVLMLLCITCASSIVYGEELENIQPIWESAPILAGHCNDDYTIQDSVANYCSFDSSLVYNYAKVVAYATDETGEKIQLQHQGNNGLSSTAVVNPNANGSVSVQFINKIPTTGTYKLSNDSKKLKNLDSNIKIEGNNTKVGEGKILYRSAPLSYTEMPAGGWNYIDIASTTLTFPAGRHVQIIVIYELKEPILIYHHVRIQYCFDTYE